MKLLLQFVFWSVSAFAADPFLGNWKVTSQYANAPWQKIVYEADSADSYRITTVLQNNERRAMLARLDGKNYSNDSDGGISKRIANFRRVSARSPSNGNGSMSITSSLSSGKTAKNIPDATHLFRRTVNS